MDDFDYVLIGGGLQNGLVAAALAARRPEARVAIVERASRVGGNHTWCFHAADIAPEARPFVEPFVAKRWPAYAVRFPGFERTLAEPYAAVTSASFVNEIERLSRNGKLAVLCNEPVVAIDRGPEGSLVTLASGRRLSTPTLVDARGPEASEGTDTIGFQKFVGLELEVELGSAPTLPLLIDARVPQRDGFRFVYVLPLASTRVLVEDTTFADGPELDVPLLRQEIAAYAAAAGLRVRAVVRQELGILPLPSRATAAPLSVPGIVRAGYQGGFFHPTTGYSFPLAVRVAATLAASEPSTVAAALTALARREARQQRYAALLNRLLFRGFAPEDRRNVLERFYRLPAATVRRFYALRLTPWDRARILCGRPPRGFSLKRFLHANELALVPAPGDLA